MGFTSEYNEMIADVVADIRNQARVFHDAAKLYGEFILTDYADRLETAEKRERGNVAALREALVIIRDMATCAGGDLGNPAIRALLVQLDKIRAFAESAEHIPCHVEV